MAAGLLLIGGACYVSNGDLFAADNKAVFSDPCTPARACSPHARTAHGSVGEGMRVQEAPSDRHPPPSPASATAPRRHAHAARLVCVDGCGRVGVHG